MHELARVCRAVAMRLSSQWGGIIAHCWHNLLPPQDLQGQANNDLRDREAALLMLRPSLSLGNPVAVQLS